VIPDRRKRISGDGALQTWRKESGYSGEKEQDGATVTCVAHLSIGSDVLQALNFLSLGFGPPHVLVPS
jgi:hypothetical protein